MSSLPFNDYTDTSADMRASLARRRLVCPSFFSFIMGVLLSTLSIHALAPSISEAKKKKDRIAVLIFIKEGASEKIRVKIERDLRNMVQFADVQKKLNARLYPIEPFFDVGQLKTALLQKAERHFNEAQRAIEGADYAEAKDQLFRADRFFRKGVPFIYNGNEELFQSIFYFNYIAHKNLKKEKKARDLYCNYVSLSRNITGSIGPIDQYDALADLCEESPISGTAELKVTANVDGAHVFINNEHVGVVNQDGPYLVPYMPAGVHLVEVRKIGYARWGKIVTLANGKSKNLRARLKNAKNYNKDFLPIAQLALRGPDAFSETYLADFFYERTYKFRVNTLLIGYLEPASKDQTRLTMITFRDDLLEPRFEATFPTEGHNQYYDAISTYWERYFGFALKPNAEKSAQNRWMPTLFKVE